MAMKELTFDTKYFAQNHDRDLRKFLSTPHSEGSIKLLIAPTGTGKTYSIVRILTKANKPTIIAVPNIGTAIEMANSEDYKAKACYGDYNLLESVKNRDLENGYVLFITYKQMEHLARLKDKLPDYFLIIDEAHDFIIKHGIYSKSIRSLEQMKNSTGYYSNLLFISATPDPVIHAEGFDNLNILRFTKDNPELRYFIKNIVVTEEESLIEATSFVIDRVPGKKLILSPSNKMLNKITAETNNAVHISADNKRKCRVFNSIVEDKVIPEDVDITIMTDLISSGLNLMNTDIENIIIAGTNDQTLIRQFSARLRKALRVNVYIVDKFNVYCNDTVERDVLVEEAKAECDRLSGITSKGETYNRRLEGETNVLSYIVEDRMTKQRKTVFIPNLYSIGAELWTQERNKNYDNPAYCFPEGEYEMENGVFYGELKSNPDLLDLLKEATEEKKELQEMATAEVYELVEEYEEFLGLPNGVEFIEDYVELNEFQREKLENINKLADRLRPIEIGTIAKLVLDEEYANEIKFASYGYATTAKTRITETAKRLKGYPVGEVVKLNSWCFQPLKKENEIKREVLGGLWDYEIINDRPFIVTLKKRKKNLKQHGFNKDEAKLLIEMFVAESNQGAK